VDFQIKGEAIQKDLKELPGIPPDFVVYDMMAVDTVTMTPHANRLSNF
jgi:hypothetical protein